MLPYRRCSDILLAPSFYALSHLFDSPGGRSMSLYFETLYAWKAKGTHHKLAMDALELLSVEYADEWSDLFLRHIESYLTGAKDPDKKFRDFRNHVLHVHDDFWGGAIKATQEWYGKARQAFADGRWKDGVYSAGVMSHYLTDVFCPLHTGQSDKENTIHRACEWSVSCSYDDLITHLLEDLEGYPSVKLDSDDDWLAKLIKAEATHANFLYSTLVEGYNFNAGVKDPPAGLDENLQKEMALTLGRATVSLSQVLDRMLKESGQKPPGVALSMHSLLAQVTIPVFWITRNMSEAADRREVQRIYNELQETGKVVDNLPEENRVIRDLVYQRDHGDALAEATATSTTEEDEGEIPVSKTFTPAPVQRDSGDDAEPVDPFAADAEEMEDDSQDQSRQNGGHDSVYLRMESPIVDAPSIGPKTAARFRKISVNTVQDFLTSEPESIVNRLATRWINLELVISWQQQAQLMCQVPGLRAHDVQLLTGVGVESAYDLAATTVDDLLPLVQEYAVTPDGQRVLRSGKIPDHAEVSEWIQNAQWGQQSEAA
ncbi:DUF4332 domain-containing protein [Rubinisphaera sp. JC750]|uniref:DUF4332 domain-containing protein n=1 Tax=Rubinisphaera sp. JC750 TaxID=2898658 RepID=UPI001F3931B6|nr:DUF4332 domain-containing protein [Rubinisphaera sp. JC750]